ncbi:DNA alkylation repair protein [Candidatus Roizmanbacteria bacterium]|nr:DNA alkylation repair protein [Candidatus Roizmanbacteria bacterium]
MNSIVSRIRQILKNQADEKVKEGQTRYFKEEVKFYGLTMPKTEKIAKEYFPKIKNLDKKEIFHLCEDFLKSGYMEEAMIAANWAYWINKQFESNDIDVFENWIDRYIDNWAECDTLCNHAVAALIERFPGHINRLKNWAKSKNLWMRRASAVTLILPARHGRFLKEIFQISDTLLQDNEDLVQKGYGWMLKAASQSHQNQVFDYVMKNKKKMPRTALRYAIEKMPKELKAKAMVK